MSTIPIKKSIDRSWSISAFVTIGTDSESRVSRVKCQGIRLSGGVLSRDGLDSDHGIVFQECLGLDVLPDRQHPILLRAVLRLEVE